MKEGSSWQLGVLRWAMYIIRMYNMVLSVSGHQSPGPVVVIISVCRNQGTAEPSIINMTLISTCISWHIG